MSRFLRKHNCTVQLSFIMNNENQRNAQCNVSNVSQNMKLNISLNYIVS